MNYGNKILIVLFSFCSLTKALEIPVIGNQQVSVQQLEQVLAQTLQNILSLSKNESLNNVSPEQLLGQVLALSALIDNLKNDFLADKCGCHHNKTRNDVLIEKCSICGGKTKSDSLVEKCGCHHNKTRNDVLIEKCPICGGKTKSDKLVEKCLSCAERHQSKMDALNAQKING